MTSKLRSSGRPHTRVATVLLAAMLLGAPACGDDEGSGDDDGGGSGGGGGGRSDAGTRDSAVRPNRDGGGGGGGGKDSGPSLPPGSCGGQSYDAEARQLDLYMMVDESGSMIPWWGSVTSALKTFIDAPEAAGIGVGMQFFGESCDPMTYATPKVPISSLPGNASALNGSFPALPLAGTPTLPALQGAIQHAREWAGSHPESKVAVLLVTDGIPSDCNSTVENVAAVAAEGFSGSPSIPTYVIGLPLLEPLNPIAVAGGTERAYAADPTNTQALVEVMNTVRGQALPCDYALPADADDPMLVNLEYVVDGTTKQIPQVSDPSKCVASAWHYDSPSAPKRLVACPETCETLKAAGGRVNVVVGCPTVPFL